MQQQIRFCKTADGVRLAYASVGAGEPPLVKAANWLSHVEYDWRTPVWRPFLERLARNRRVVRYDARGCGLSDWDVDEYSLEVWVRDLEAVVDAAGLKRFSLLGISQGGPIAIAYAARHPERVSRLILLGSYACGWLKRNSTPAQLEEYQLLIDTIRVGWGRESPAFRQVFTSRFIPGGTRAQLEWFNDLCLKTTSGEIVASLLEARGHVDISASLAGVRVPTLVLHGSRTDDRLKKAAAAVAGAVPGSQHLTLAGQTHNVKPAVLTPAVVKFFTA